MKYNPKRIVYSVIIITTILWVFTHYFSAKDPNHVKKEISGSTSTQITDASSPSAAQDATDYIISPKDPSLGESPSTADPASSTVQETVPLSYEEIKAAIDAFAKWSKDYLAADPEKRAEMEKEGVILASQRRIAFKQLIQQNPRQAIEFSLPRVVRQDLPKTITDLLEAPVSAKGNYNVYLGKVAPGLPTPKEALALRYFETESASYRAYVYGDLTSVMSRVGTPLQGVAIDGHFAIAENAVRRLEDGERIPKGILVKETCPVSKQTTTSVAEGEAVTGQTPTVEIGGEFITLCNGSHVTVLEDNYRTYIQSSGPGGGGFFIDNYPGTASRAIGNLRCLYMRVTYPDQMEQPNTEEQAYADMRDNARFYLENSYGKMTQTATVTPVLVLPRTLAWYKAKDSANGGTLDCLGLVHSDARAAAKAAGYDTAQFDCNIVRINKGPRLEGISWGGGSSVWITWNGMDVMNHEIGHSLSLNHANYWTSLDGTAYGYGDNEEYGNIFDVMGNGGGFNDHYNTASKRFLNWLPNSYVHEPVINGTYRLYAYDQPRIEEGKRYSLRVAKDARSYNLEYHPAAGGYLADGAVVIYTGAKSLTGGGTNAGHLIDTTPGTLAGKNDSPIALGRTYSDPEADMHFTVVAKNLTLPESIDVVYNKGPFPGNVAPTATLTSTSTTISTGGSVTFTASANDVNGDPLAYHWDFSDGETGTNSSVYTRTFSTAAQITAMLTVSDMKGGTVRRSIVVNVGAHGKQTISGTVTAGGVGVQGVYVSFGTSSTGKGCYTNADGTYSLTGVSTGSQTLTAILPGYTFTPSGFTNPLTVVAGTNTANWTASASTFVTLAKITDATEGGSNGTFSLTRTGSTASALTVLVAPVTGSAVKNTDYTFSPDYTALGSYFTFTIPAGSATLNVTCTPTDDTAAEGPETIRLQVASGTGYYSSSTNAAVMTLVDNDTSLPQVSVTAPDPYATEFPTGDNGTFTFSRTGATTSSLNLTVAWGGTSTNGSDYSTLSTTVTIPSGQSSTTVTLTPTNDSAIEVPETATATISANAAYVLDISASSATVTITDDDTPFVTVSTPDSVASEAGGDSGVFLISRTGSTAASLKVYYGISGSAAHGTDYARLTGEVTIPAGATSAPVVISPFNDDIAEPSEDVTLIIPTFNNAYSVGTGNSATLTILDNGDVPLVNVRASTDGTEGGSNTAFIFHAIGTGTGNITVNYTISGTATSGSDFAALSGSISIPASGSTSTTLTVPITNDTALEPTETIILTITPSLNYRVYNDSVAEGIIFDNDSGDRVMVSTFNQTPTETGTTGDYYISRTGTTGNLTVNYAMSGTATNGSDYNTLSGSVVIPSGATGVDLTMTPINDTTQEGTETVILTILPGTGYGVDIPSSATYTITDNDTPSRTVGFQATTTTTNELPDVLGQYRDIPVTLSSTHTSVVTLDYYAGGGNAAGNDEDWTFVDAADGNKVIPGGTLTFAPGVTSRNIRIKINNDGVGEANETFVIQLARAYNAAISTATNTVTINDTAGAQSIRLITSATTRSETDGSEPMLQAILDRPAESAISVSYSATGTATSGSDYTLTGTSLSFAVGEQMKSIPLTFLTDAVIEAPETIIITLSNPVGAYLNAPASHTITLRDASAPVVSSQFVSAASTQSVGTLITTATASLSSGRTVSNWTILSGNTGNLFTLNSTSGQLTLTTPASLPNPGGVQLIVKVTDNAGASGTGAINVICNAPANPVSELRWTGTNSYFAEDWTQTSSYSGTLLTLTSGTNVGTSFSRRLTTYLKPQTSGDYTFWIAGDDECRLYLSTDGYEANKVEIASVVGSTSYQAWDTYNSQMSVPISLVAGKVYWIEAQHVENSGNDSVSVAWSGPSISRVAIPSSVLVATAPGLSFPLPESGIGTNTAPNISNVADRVTDAGASTGAISFTVGDTETPTGALVVSGSSSDLTLLPQSNIVFGGSGANRTVTLTPAQGQTGNVTITLTVTDGLKSSSDTFLLAVGSSQIVAFKYASNSATEATNPALIEVTMNTSKVSPVTVDYAVTGGSATSGSDYNLTAGTVTFNPGETLKTISLAVINDNLGESNETVEISLGNAVGAVIGSTNSHTYTIVNDDTDFSIVATDASAAETGPSPGTFTITRAGLTAASVTVNLTRSGTASNSSDYSSIPSTITFAAGETVKTITVTPVDDLIVEGDETVTIAIAAGTGYAVGSPSSDTVTIADNDVDISIVATTPNATEGSNPAGVFTVTRTGITTGSTVVNLTIGGTATPSTDYTAIASTLTFSAGQTSRTINVSVNTITDTIYEDSESVTLTVAAGTGYQPASPSSATVTIADNDKPTISVTGTVTAASETGPVAGLLTFTRTGWTGIAQDINLTITGTATSGSDYTALPTTVSFAANSDTATLAVPVIDDSLFEVAETVIVTIATNAAYTVAGSPNNAATVTIADNDKPTVTLVASDAIAAEASTANPGAFTLTRTGTTVAALTVNYTLSGSAINGTDYTSLTGSVTFAAASANATVAITVTNDTEYEDTEDVILTLSADPSYLIGAPSTDSVTIADNDKPTISVAGTVIAASETGPVAGLLTFTRTGWTGITQDINLTFTGTATSGSDYTGLPTTVSFAANSATATLSVPVIDDSLFEVAETVIVTISANAAYTVGTPSNATVTIADDDKPTVTVAATDAAAAEATTANPGAFTLTRTGTTAAALTVNYTVSGTAINGTDYTSLTGSVTFAANSATATVAITVTNETEYENTEDVILTLSADPAYLVGAPSTGTVTITDNDLPTISVAGTTTAAAETGPVNGLLTFTRTGWTGPALDVTVAITGTATSGSDYTALPTTVSFAANSATATLSVPVIDDSLFEVAETVIVTISVNAAYTVGAPSNVTVTIADNDKPTVTVVATDAVAAEATTANPGAFTFTRTGTTIATLTVNYILSGTAINGTDYTSLTGSVTFAANSATATVAVTVTNDSEYENTEDVILTLSADPTYLIGATSTDSVTIADNDLPTVSISASNTSPLEGGAASVLTFSRSGVTNLGPLTILYAPSGTATVGSDYAPMSGNITIPQGQSSATLNADLIQDNVTEAPETLIVTITANAAYLATAPTNAANLTILDDTEAVAVNIVVTDNLASEPLKGDGTGLFTITRSGSATAALTVNLLATGTATNGTDYSTLPATVTIPAGQTSATVTITPIDDLEAEVDETVILNLLAGSGYSVGATTNAIVNLYDDEAAEVRVEVTDAKCLETTATADPGAFTLRRLGNRTAALTVNYTVPQTGNFATSGTDYTALTGAAALAANSGSVAVAVTPINDALVEGTETVILTLAPGTGYAINVQNTGTIAIRDDETVDVTVSAQEPNCAEQATPDTGNFRITRIPTATTSLVVSYTITGTATNGTDYTTLNGTATIAANAAFVDIVVTPANDGILEGSESVIMTLTGAGSTYDLGDANTATIWIKDDETPTVTLIATDAAASEGDGSPVDNGLYTFTASFAPVANLTINYTVSGGTNGADYNYLTGSIVLPAGQTSITLPLVPIDDQMPEASETIGLTLANGTNYNVGTTTAVNVVIAANDTPTASIVAFDSNATENSTNTGRFIVTLSKAVTGNTNVTYTVGGTANSGTDYTALTGTAQVITGANSAIITVTPLNDATAEGPESVTVTLTAAASYTLGSPTAATVVIADDEAPATPLAGWKQSSFGTDWNDPAISGDAIDYDSDGIANLIEYALGSDPMNQNSQAVQSTTNTGSLKLTFNRAVASNDVTIIVQATDNLTGTWTDIASSINGGVTTSLVAGCTVSETGTGSTRSIAVTDIYTTNDPAHPRRFMRIRVNP